jgi:hypothetical protein
MSEQEEKLLYAVALMAQQYLETAGGLDHIFMSAGEHALAVLAEYELVSYDGVSAQWTAKGRAFLARR